MRTDTEGDLAVESDEIPVTDDDFNRSMEKRIEQAEEVATKFTQSLTGLDNLSAIEIVSIIFPIVALIYLIGRFGF